MKALPAINFALVTLSLIISSFVVVVHLVIRKMLRPPGDLIFMQSIAQVIIDIHWYSALFTSGIPESHAFCTFTGAITVFFTAFSSNCILCLCIEITLKLMNRTSAHNKVRRIAYYIFVCGFSLFLVILATFHGDYGHTKLKTCSARPQSLTSNIRLANFIVDILIQIALVAYMLKKIGKVYSKLTLNYFLVVLAESIFIFLSNFFKLLTFANIDDLTKEIFIQISSFAGVSTGIAIGLSRLSNKRLMTEIFWKFRGRSKKKVYSSNTSSMIESDSSLLNQNVYNISDMFESITSKSLVQMIAAIYIRFTYKNIDIENEVNFDEFLFEPHHFRELSDTHGIRSIQEIYVPGLCLIEYMPSYFFELRQEIGLSNEKFIESFNLNENMAKLGSIKKASGGRSEATIFFTNDNQFVVKTVSRKERKYFMGFAKKYRERITKESCLVRIVAIFRLTPVNTDYIIMENTSVNNQNAILFDIKGSIVNRWVDIELKNETSSQGVVLKDLNMIRGNYKVEIGKKESERLMRMIRNDLDFLLSVEATDYSVLLCFYQPGINVDSRYVFKGRTKNYSISIIDYLQKFNLYKKTEKFFKKMVYKSVEISIAEPWAYRDRLLKFINEIINESDD